MRKMLLAVVCVGSGAFMLLVFGMVVLYDVLPPRLEPVMGQETALPMEVPQTALRVLQLTEYAGPFLEDPDSRETVRSAALLVENGGGLYIARGAVVIEQRDRTLVFEISDLPPGGKALVLEKDAQPYVREPDWSCYGWTREEYPEQQSWVSCEQHPQGLAVTNVADHTLPVVQLTYKRRCAGSQWYAGGISFQTLVKDLLPGETRILRLDHYTQDKIQVVRTLVYVE